MSKRFLLSAIFAVGTMGVTASAGEMQVLNEEELDRVSAQGLQTISNDNRHFADINGQKNNLDSVQLNDNAQDNTQAAGIINVSKSAVNAAINILLDGEEGDGSGTPDPDKSYSYEFSQTNIQTAINHMNIADNDDMEEHIALAFNLNKESQSVSNNGDITNQDNNNNSVQLNDNAQISASALIIENVAISATNTGLNVFVAGNVDSTNGSQTNLQVAMNMGNYAEAQTVIRDPETGEVIEGPVAVAGNGELWVTQDITNTYGSEVDDEYVPHKIVDQDNNNNSVQLNKNAQQTATALSLMNVANSAYNSALNLISTVTLSNSSISQTNDQAAENHVNVAKADAENGIAIAGNLNKQTQNVKNAEGTYQGSLAYIEDQDNNNNSVQLNDSAQQSASALDITNSAVSAGNTGINIAAATNVSKSTLTQSNIQSAENFDNKASSYTGNSESESVAAATNAEVAGQPGQWVHNVHVKIDDQNNNNNSVQLNDSAQDGASALNMTNMAQSSVNSGINILFVDGAVDSSTVTQTNEQYASNHNNYATADGLAIAVNLNKQRQIIENCFCSDLSTTDQDNNMNSVQLNDFAQGYATGWMVVNAATSAVNGGTNLAVVNGVVSNSVVTQTNIQTSINFSNQASGNTAIAGNVEIGSLTIPMPAGF